MREETRPKRLHGAAVLLGGAELALLGALLLGARAALYPLAALTLPLAFLLAADGLRLRGLLSRRPWRRSALLYGLNLAAAFLLVSFGMWLHTIFGAAKAASAEGVLLRAAVCGTEALLLLEVWLSALCRSRRRGGAAAVWCCLLGTLALFLLFALGEYAVSRSVNPVIALVQSLLMAEGWLLIHALKRLFAPAEEKAQG